MRARGVEYRTALVTGGTRGIGKAVALQLLKAGVRVIVSARSQGNLDSQLCFNNDRLTFIRADLGHRGEVKRLASETIAHFGRLDYLVNNAAEIHHAALDGYSFDDWRRTLAVNLDAPFMLCRELLPSLRVARGAIVNISSTAPRTCPARTSAYAASKAGLEAFSKVLAKEEAPHGVRVNVVAPGPTKTDMLAETAAQGVAGGLGALRAAVPLGDFGTPTDVANAVLFLLSETSAHVTGHVLAVNGGLAT